MKKRKKTKRPARPTPLPRLPISPARLAAAPPLPVAAPQRDNPVWFFGFAGVFIVLVIFAATPPTVAESPPSKQTQPEVVQLGSRAPTQGHPMDEPLQLLAAARESFAHVTDYSCTLVKQERIKGELHQPHVVQVAVRNQPFSVSMKWSEPKCMLGQEAIYVDGQNNGQMRVKSAGLLAKLGYVSLDVNDPRTRKTTNHTITEAGIANLLNRYTRRWEQAKVQNKVQVKVGDYEYNKRRCTRVETIQPERDPSIAYYRNVVFFDLETHLPVRVECYDWPTANEANGELLEVYNYLNVQLNVNLVDATFTH